MTIYGSIDKNKKYNFIHYYFQDVTTNDLKAFYKRLKKYLRPEVGSDTDESMKRSNRSGSDLENVIQKLQVELQEIGFSSFLCYFLLF